MSIDIFFSCKYNALNALGVGGPTQGVLILVSLRCGCVRLDDPIGYWLYFAPLELQKCFCKLFRAVNEGVCPEFCLW